MLSKRKQEGYQLKQVMKSKKSPLPSRMNITLS